MGMQHIRVGVVGLNVSRDTRVLRAVTTGTAGLAFLLRGVDGVEPEHVGVVLSFQLAVWHFTKTVSVYLRHPRWT